MDAFIDLFVKGDNFIFNDCHINNLQPKYANRFLYDFVVRGRYNCGNFAVQHILVNHSV